MGGLTEEELLFCFGSTVDETLGMRPGCFGANAPIILHGGDASVHGAYAALRLLTHHRSATLVL